MSESEEKVAKKIKKTEFMGWGTVVQLIGLCIAATILMGNIIGLIIGIIVFLLGTRMLKKFLCGNCGNKVTKEASMCPTCKYQIFNV